MINLYTNSTIGSYTTGTVTCTNNSATVTGTGTTWSEIVNPGDILTLNDDKLYVIKTVNSNTSITLDKVFAENTVSNSAYRIFLNTAAHFPSDTAAKVERALEQLSDINEAAINNDRTVTAATKVNGKGLSSTMGDLHLNPASVNTNRGGTINFHYNQASSVTSSIYENQSGRIKLDGNVEVAHSVTAYEPISTANGNNFRVTRPLNTNIRPITNFNGAQRWDMPLVYVNATDGKILSSVYTPFKFISDSNYMNSIQLLAYNPLVENQFELLGIGYDQNGVYTFAPTPATTDNSIKIATTAWVMNRLNTYYKDLGDNYVMNVSDFDKCGVIYHIGSLSTATTINYPAGNNNNGDWAMYCLRTGSFTTLVGVTPRSAKLFYAKFWSGNFNGWCVFDPVSISS